MLIELLENPLSFFRSGGVPDDLLTFLGNSLGFHGVSRFPAELKKFLVALTGNWEESGFFEKRNF